MAYLFSLIVLFVGAIGAPVHASVSLQPYYLIDMMGATQYPNEAAACTAAVAFDNNRTLGSNSFRVFSAVKPSNGQMNCWTELFERTSGASLGGAVPFVPVLLGGQSCPVNSAAAGGACRCSSGYVEEGNACIAPGTSLEQYCRKLDGSTAPLRVRSSTINSLGQVCEVPYFAVPGLPDGHGCVSELGSGIKTRDAEGVLWTQATGVTSSATCTGPLAGEGDGGVAEPTKDPCPNGSAASVNGIQICTPHDPTAPVDWAGTKTTENSDGSTIDVATETRCNAGVCSTTTTTTTTAQDGSTSSVSSTTKDSIGGTCATNPANGVCSATGTGNGAGGGGGGGTGRTGFRGSCATGFAAVSDDAVQNAMAEEMHRQNCKVTPDEGSKALAEAERVKSGDRTVDNPANSTIELSSASFDTSDALNAGSACISDKTITVAGGVSVSLPFSRACDGFPLLGSLLMALSFLVAGVIVLRG